MSERPPFRPPDRFPQRPPFRPAGPGRPPDSSPPSHSIRLRDGEREIDVSGSPAFVRQVLDDLPLLLARLRGEPMATPSSIRMPAATPAGVPEPAAPVAYSPVPPPPAEPAAAVSPPTPARAAATDGRDPLEGRIFAVLRGASRPLAIAAIREQLGDDLTGQQVRRILERAGNRVVTSGDRPMKYRLRG